MVVNVREKSVEEIDVKLNSMNTSLNKISYLESALRVAGTTFEIKRFIYGRLADLYAERRMFDKAANAIMNKATIDLSAKDKLDSFVHAAEFFCKAGRIDDADDIFHRALGEFLEESSKAKVRLAKKNLYLMMAQELENSGKAVSALKFYESLLKTPLADFEKVEIRKKLAGAYRKLGRFKEAELMEGL